MKIYSNLIILGSGPAGMTASLYSTRLGIQSILITGKDEGGQLLLTSNIENWPGIYKKTTGYELYKKFYNQLVKIKTKIINDYIKNIIFLKNKTILFSKNNIYICRILIISTGSTPKKIGIENEEKYWGKGISNCTICDGPLYKKKIVAIIGGGNKALEEALYLSKICEKVYLIHRRNIFKAENITINKIENKYKYKNIHIYKNYILYKIFGNNENIYKIHIKNIIDNSIKEIYISGIFIAIGSKPNTDLFINKIDLTELNYIKININSKYFTSTSIEGVFAAGDVVNIKYKQAIVASSLGCISAIDVKNYIDNNNLK